MISTIITDKEQHSTRNKISSETKINDKRMNATKLDLLKGINSTDGKSSRRNINGMTSEGSNTKNEIFQVKDFILVQRIVRKINSILDTKELLKQIVEDVSKTLGFARCAVMLYDEHSDTLDIAALTGWEDNRFQVGYKIPNGFGIIWKAFNEGKVKYFPDVIDLPGEELCDFTSKSHIDIPLVQHGRIIGILNAQHWEADAFSKHDIRILRMLASHIAIALQNSRLFELERKEKERMLGELREASDIQMRLFPKNAPQVTNFEIAGMCEPCKEVGGDWFDYIELPSGKIGVVLADVAGKGLGAALLMSSARTIMRMVALQEESPAEVLRKVNSILTDDIPPARFITMVYAVIDPEKREVTIANAGHHYPAMYSDHYVKYLVLEAGLPLGIKDHIYKEYNFTMESSDKLFLYSDGVPEAMDSEKEMFGNERLVDSLQVPGANISTLYHSVKNFVGDIPLSDDLTIVMIEST